MINKLTILIPVYNDDASSLVQTLVAEARNVKGLDYEIIVFDDVAPMLVALMPIIGLPYCLVVIMFQLRITIAVHPCAMQCYVRADTSGVL